jgi:hypothetical protein
MQGGPFLNADAIASLSSSSERGGLFLLFRFARYAAAFFLAYTAHSKLASKKESGLVSPPFLDALLEGFLSNFLI